MSAEAIEDLIFKAHECIQNSDITGAMELGKQILAKDTDNTKGLEIMGYILLEMNCLDEAKFCFTKSIEDGSNDSHVPYIYLGQLSEGERSQQYFLKAIEMMQKNLTNSEDKKILFRPTKLDVSNAYVSLSELYMAELRDTEDAEKHCRDYISKAAETDATNPAPYQALASLNLLNNQKELAKEAIEKSLALWLPAAMAIIGDMDAGETVAINIVNTCELSTELRTKCAVILNELELFTEARSVLDTILVEDDEHFQAHYLMALTLEAVLDRTAVEQDSVDRDELLGLIEDHAEMAMGLANPEEDVDAVSKIMALMDKIGAEHGEDDDEMGSSDSDEDDDDDEEEDEESMDGVNQ